jgi:uncharacterized membrane protein YfcA
MDPEYKKDARLDTYLINVFVMEAGLIESLMILSGLSFITSLITAAIGMGGGLILLASLPSFLPAQAIIPLHGAVQLSSNLSRWLFEIKKTCIKPLFYYFVGSLIGSYAGFVLIDDINLAYMPLILSVFILLILWTPIYEVIKRIPGRYFSLGIFQTAIALYVGATGPLSTSILYKDQYSRDNVIVTNAAINTLVNIAKIIVYSAIGFIFYDYLYHIIFMSILAILGSYVGARLRGLIKEKSGALIIKILVTLLCFKNLVSYFF